MKKNDLFSLQKLTLKIIIFNDFLILGEITYKILYPILLKK